MAVSHLTIRRYKINIRPENFRPMIFQCFGEAADLIVGQMLYLLLRRLSSCIFSNCLFDFLVLYSLQLVDRDV